MIQPAEQTFWNSVIDGVSPYIVSIDTPLGHSTGFLCGRNASGTVCGIVAAYDVMERAVEKEQPVCITHYESGETTMLNSSDRIIFPDPLRETSCALIALSGGRLPFPRHDLPLLAGRLNTGDEVVWLGLPRQDPERLCFFTGRISAWMDHRDAYLLDGVGVNGISGGPVATVFPGGRIGIVGAITASLANRAAGNVIPGLSLAEDIQHFQDLIRENDSPVRIGA